MERLKNDRAIILVQSERKKQLELDCNKKSSSLEVRAFDIDGGGGWSIQCSVQQ